MYLKKFDYKKMGLQIKKNKKRKGKVDNGKMKKKEKKTIFISLYFKN
jgi:hypothetical protein